MNPILSIELLLPLLAAVVAGMLVFGWRSSATLNPGRRYALLALRLAGAAGLVLLALNPGRWVAPVERADSDWALLIDRSASMATADVDGHERWAAALQLAARASSLGDDAARVRVFSFAGGLDEQAASLEAVRSRVKPDGEATDIIQALDELFARYQARQRSLAGVLVLSDGRQPVSRPLDDVARQARALAAPVYTVALGGPVATPDLAVEPLQTLSVGFAGSALRVAARVRNTHLGPQRVRVRLLAADGREAAATQVDLAADAVVPVTLTLTPAAGYAGYTWAVDPPAGDAIPDNNRAPVGVLALREPLRVLVAEGVPHWDSKFFVQWLRKQPQFSLTTVHRLASDRFFRIAGESGTEDALTREVFPDTLEDLAAYDLVVLGKGAEYFLTGDRPALLRRYVRDLGGSVLLARAKAYHGAFAGLADIEPLTWAAGVPVDTPGAVWQPTPEGESAGLFGGVLPPADSPVWGRLPKVTPQYRTGDLPSFASVLVSAEGPGGTRTPLVAVRRYGKGRTAAVNVQDFWRWDLFPAMDESSALYKAFWPELAQWLATHGDFLPGRALSLRLSASRCAPGEAVQLVLQRRGVARPGDPVVRVMAAGQPDQVLRPQRLPGDEGWTALLAPPEPGLYRLEAAMDGAAGGTEAAAIALLRVARPPAERDERSADPALLDRLAEATGGTRVTAADLEKAVRAFDRKAPDMTDAPPVWKPAWDRGAWLALLLAAFGLEWFVRRRSGLT